MNRKPAPRRYKIGEAVVWTDFADGTPHRCEVLGHIEPGDDDYHDYDPTENGPLYSVRREADMRGMQVAEDDLSPLPPPSLEVVGDQDQT